MSLPAIHNLVEPLGIVTDIAIQNPTSTTMTFPSTTSMVIGVDEIMPGAEMAAGADIIA